MDGSKTAQKFASSFAYKGGAEARAYVLLVLSLVTGDLRVLLMNWLYPLMKTFCIARVLTRLRPNNGTGGYRTRCSADAIIPGWIGAADHSHMIERDEGNLFPQYSVEISRLYLSKVAEQQADLALTKVFKQMRNN